MSIIEVLEINLHSVSLHSYSENIENWGKHKGSQAHNDALRVMLSE